MVSVKGSAAPPAAHAFKHSTTINAPPLNLSLSVTTADDEADICVTFARNGAPIQGPSEPMFMHWGAVLEDADDKSVYRQPHKQIIPAGSNNLPGQPSQQSPFDDDGKLTLTIPQRIAPAGIVFLVFIRAAHGWREQWFKNIDGSSFYIDLTGAISESELARRRKDLDAAEVARLEAARAEKELAEKEARIKEELKKKEQELKDQREIEATEFLSTTMDTKKWKIFNSVNQEYDFGSLYIRVFTAVPKNDASSSTSSLASSTTTGTAAGAGADGSPTANAARLPGHILVASTLALEGSDIIFHWGIKKLHQSGWSAPDTPANLPPSSIIMPDGKAIQTKLALTGDSGLRTTVIKDLEPEDVGLYCVIHAPGAPNHLQWIKGSNGQDIYVQIIPPPPLPGFSKGNDVSDACKSMLDQIIEREMEYGSWTLMHRYGFARYLVDSVIKDDTNCWSSLYVWMRYSQIRVLDWQRKYNTQPRQLSWAQLSFVTLLANKFQNVPSLRWLCRLVMSCVGRGGSGDLGQRIRDDILVILRHNREWKHGSMMEQWHQKLHNNTSPDDVVICDALIQFWESNGDMRRYWDVIYSNGVTRERMAAYEQAITTEPDFLGHLKGTMLHELGRYGDLLRQVHLGTDLNFIVGRCQGPMADDVRHSVNHFMHDRHSQRSSLIDLMYDVADARQKLTQQLLSAHNLNDEAKRDLIFLDLAIESEARRLLEGQNGNGHDGTLWSHLAIIKAASLSLRCTETGLKTQGELDRAVNELDAVIDRLSHQGESHDVGLRAAAAMNIMKNVLTEIVDRYAVNLGPLSRCLGLSFHADKTVVNTFIEEAVRGGPAFALSLLLKKADTSVRRVANLGPFSVIAPFDKAVKGPVVVFDKLRECIGATFKKNTTVIANVCDGDEDVPENTSYVVIGSSVDVLSHVSVRARNEHHGLIACLDADKLAELRALHGCIVRARLQGEDFMTEVVDASGQMSPSVGVQAVMKRIKSTGLITPPSGLQTPPDALFPRDTPRDDGALPNILLTRTLSERSLQLLGQKKRAIGQRQLSAPWAIRPSEFNAELVGSKSLNLQRLVALGLPDWIRTPVSVAIPYGALRKVLNLPINQDLAAEYADLLAALTANDAAGKGKGTSRSVRACKRLREVVTALELPEGMKETIRGILDDLGCDDIDANLPAAWAAIKGVWASMWNERAFLARHKAGIEQYEDIDMAVLCQIVIDAEYAFVIHTTNPLTHDSNEIYAEAVVGLGETLVSNAPGQALGFTIRKDEDLDVVKPIVRNYPSKVNALHGGHIIFRSDSNAEDLEGFAGAGLHDSIPLSENDEVNIDYADERIMKDDEFRDFLMRGIAKIGAEVEDIMGGAPQDIEGCYKDGEFYVVQARPQV